MTKTAKIMALYEQGKTTREIADEIGCLTSYVRVVTRQRKGRGSSKHDKKWREANPEYLSNWIEKNRERWNAYSREYYRRRKRAEANQLA